MNAADRFWCKVEKTPSCWLWKASPGSTGYGQFSVGGRNGTMMKAHRFAFLLTHGRLPVEIDHTCNNTLCVNPAHLEEVTHEENMKRMSARKTHCIHGHDYSQHAKMRKSGRRYCGACWR